MQNMDTQKAQMVSASGPWPGAIPRARRCTPACVFMLPLLKPYWKEESSATATVCRNMGVKPEASSTNCSSSGARERAMSSTPARSQRRR